MTDRADLARQHSAEHILNAVMQRDFGTGRSIEAHFGEKKSKCDYAVDHSLNDEDLVKIEAAVNAEIEADHPVTTFEISREEADAKHNMGKVPDSATTIRIVQIGDLDVIPCVGRHVEHTRQIGRFIIRSADMKDDNTVRIRFSLEQ
jgi:misacylated tRNA(Ala) deacylase